MKGKTLFAIIGWSLLGLAFLTFVLRALLKIWTGSDWGYKNSLQQPMTYLGALGTLVLAILVCAGAWLYDRWKRASELKRSAKVHPAKEQS